MPPICPMPLLEYITTDCTLSAPIAPALLAPVLSIAGLVRRDRRLHSPVGRARPQCDRPRSVSNEIERGARNEPMTTSRSAQRQPTVCPSKPPSSPSTGAWASPARMSARSSRPQTIRRLALRASLHQARPPRAPSSLARARSTACTVRTHTMGRATLIWLRRAAPSRRKTCVED